MRTLAGAVWQRLSPGTGLKRWGAVAVLGVLAGVVAGQLVQARQVGWALVASLAGVSLAVTAVRRVALAVATALAPGERRPLPDVMRQRRERGRGPRVVAIGGGTGLSVLLRGLKEHSHRLTAIVTVADDGGSSGRLRQEMGILPPGDIRNTLVAMADTEPLLERLFQYRFTRGEGLTGHSFGNLFIAAMSDITGDFQEAIRQFSRVLAVKGQVLPSTLTAVQLEAEFEDGSRILGESAIAAARKPIRTLRLVPPDARAVPEALEMLESADIVVLGPGSLYTSVIPNLLVQDLAEALRRTAALRVYICNVMTQPGETDGYTALDHLQAILRHAGPGLLDCVVVHRGGLPASLLARYEQEGAHPVHADLAGLAAAGVVVVSGPLVAPGPVARHDPARLAEVVVALAVLGRGFAPPGAHLSVEGVLAMAQHRGLAGRLRGAVAAGG